MSRLFLSILGKGSLNRATGKFEYGISEYVIDGEKLPSTRYIQEASIRHFCKGWDAGQGDRIQILCTEESLECQWQNDSDECLSACLEKLSHIPEYAFIDVTNAAVNMPQGKSKEEIWKIFDVLFESVHEGDEIWLDVTHGFRSIPMLVLTAVPYLRLLKKADIKSITYGAYEAKSEDGGIPVFDLTDFIDLMDWTNAARNFVEYGRFDDCKKLMDDANRSILSETKGKDEEASLSRNVSGKVDDFCRRLIQNRLDATVKKGLAADVFNGLHALKNRSLRVAPFKPLIEKIENKLSAFSTDSYANVFAAVDWCVEHRFLQNGYSILLEGCISIAMEKVIKDGLGKGICLDDEENRKLPIDVATAWIRKLEDEDKVKLIPYRETIYVGKKEYAEAFELLNKTRNAFMHCGTGPNKLPAKIGDLENKLRESNETLKQWYKELGV